MKQSFDDNHTFGHNSFFKKKNFKKRVKKREIEIESKEFTIFLGHEVDKSAETILGHLLDAGRTSTDGVYGGGGELLVVAQHVRLKLAQNDGDIGGVRQTRQDLELEQLDVYAVVRVHVEALLMRLEHAVVSLRHRHDVLQHDDLHLAMTSQQTHQRFGHDLSLVARRHVVVELCNCHHDLYQEKTHEKILTYAIIAKLF